MLIEIKAGQFRKVSRLVRRECCNCMDGNCLLLDDGETHTCVQLISKYHIFCNHFKNAVLPFDKELYRELICGNDYKRCQSCGSRFYSRLATNATATNAPRESSGRRQPNASAVSVSGRSSSYI